MVTLEEIYAVYGQVNGIEEREEREEWRKHTEKVEHEYLYGKDEDEDEDDWDKGF